MKYTYLGRRIIGTGKGKIVHAFQMEGETSVITHWPKAKAAMFYGLKIGAIYDLAEEGRLPDSWSKVWVGKHENEAEIAAWEGKDTEVGIFRTERNISPTPKMDAAMKVLGDARLGISPAKRLAFDLWVIDKLRGWK